MAPTEKQICKCDIEARRLVVKKDGKNHGRGFYQCSKPWGPGRCGFFVWADKVEPETTWEPAAATDESNGKEKKDEKDEVSPSKKEKVEKEKVEKAPLQKQICKCDIEARRLTVKKEGKNQGRGFYQCSKVKCGFHVWADTVEPETTWEPAPKRVSEDSVDEPVVKKKKENEDKKDAAVNPEPLEKQICKCDVEARRLTVKKDGKNKGRGFYQCSKVKCGFHVWADEVEPGTTWVPDAAYANPEPLEKQICKCNTEARRLTVKKDGKNKGRGFYQCSKVKCGFHVWADKVEPGTTWVPATDE